MRLGYTRKKLNADCFNPSDWESQVSIIGEPCPCSIEDYEVRSQIWAFAVQDLDVFVRCRLLD